MTSTGERRRRRELSVPAAGAVLLAVAALVTSLLAAPPIGPPAAADTAGTATATVATATAGTAAAGAELAGYWLVDERGHVHAFGQANHRGEGPYGTVAIAALPDGSGYWVVTGSGVVVPRGAAPDLGPPPPLRVGERVVGITATASGRGAWLFTSRGAVHPRGDAPALGDASGLPLNQPVIAGAATATGRGYWLVATDGGVFAYGDAAFWGSMGGIALNAPVMGLVPTPTGGGYWLVASDGGVFSFGDAPFQGSLGSVPLNRPIRGMVAAGHGYLMVAADGGVFAFGPGVAFHGSLGAAPPPDAVVAIAPIAVGGAGPLVADQAFRATIEAVPPSRLASSWRPGCPVRPDQLRLLTVDHWDFDGLSRTGELVVHRDVAADVVSVVRTLHAARFPIARMELVDRYGGDDDRSMAANNTSAFNCRAVTGGTAWSEHAYGRAIDLNPVQNPYVRGSTVLPPQGRSYLDRTIASPGMLREGDAAVRAFDRLGWAWGGRWADPDYQHVSATGR